ncbi:MAG: c-type cytochrome [Adhaeribacter sp.]
MKLSTHIPVLLFLLGLASCANDSEEELYGDTGLANCNQSQVTYALTVKPILQQNCYSCHSGGFVQGNVHLDDYNGVKTQMDNGKLLASIRHEPGHPPMPQLAPKLSDCNIALIAKWFDAGSPNN